MMQRRLAMPQKRTQQNNSQQNIEQLLSTLPTLAYEPELTDLRMSESEFGKLLENNHANIENYDKQKASELINKKLTKISC